jgi:hypothetical protein
MGSDEQFKNSLSSTFSKPTILYKSIFVEGRFSTQLINSDHARIHSIISQMFFLNFIMSNHVKDKKSYEYIFSRN